MEGEGGEEDKKKKKGKQNHPREGSEVVEFLWSDNVENQKLRYVLWKYLWLVEIKAFGNEVLAGDSNKIK